MRRVNLLRAHGSPTNYGYSGLKCRCLSCRAVHNARIRKYADEHPGYYRKYGTANHYGHVCEHCGSDFKSHKSTQHWCSVACMRDARADVLAKRGEEERQRRLPVLHLGPVTMSPLHPRHPARTLNPATERRLFVGGTCARCGRTFVVYSPSGHARFCSLSCARAAGKSTRRARKRGAHHVPYRRIDIFIRDDWRCHICGKRTRRDVRAVHALAPTIDHLVPLSKGGPDSPENVACAHFVCNAVKSDRGGAQLLLVG